MRLWPLFAAFAMLPLLPAASAAGSSVELSGPATIRSAGPTSATLDVELLLDGVVCTGVTDIPVKLRIAETRGVRSSSLSWDEILFRIAPQQAATQPFRGEAEVGVRVWGRDPVGHVEVLASYALPPSCVAPGGETSGEARHRFRVEVPPAEETAMPLQAFPPPVPKSETVLAPAEAKTDTLAELQRLPGPVLGAIVGMLAGGLMVVIKRMRGAPA